MAVDYNDLLYEKMQQEYDAFYCRAEADVQ